VVVNLANFRAHVKAKSPAFVPAFVDQSRYQVLYGGAGCVHPETKIHTEYGLIRICDIDRPMRVLSWDRKNQKFQLSLSGGSFPKGRGNLYRIVTQHGEFQSSAHHLVLLSTGEYRRADSLQIGDEISLAQPSQSLTIEEHCRLLSLSDDPHYSQKVVNYLGDYANECRRYDPQPHENGDYALFSEPKLNDALAPCHSCSPLIGNPSGILQRHSRPCLCGDPSCRTCFCAKGQRFAGDEASHSEASSSGYISRSHLNVLQSRQMTALHRKEELSGEAYQAPFGLLGNSSLEPSNCEAILSGSSLVKSIEVVEISEYWCMQVLNTNNYISEDGAIHHNSGKSHIVARKILYRLLKEHDVNHNFLVIRKVDRTIKRSVFRLIRNIISRWKLADQFEVNLTDKTIIYKHNGSQIMFSGLDDVEKLKSIEGVTSIWVEEATELTQEDFEQLDLRLRGDHGCLKQIILTFNPISEQHWIKKIFFDDPIQGVFTLHTTYLDNVFIDDEYKMVMENKKKTNPRYYNIYALGNWGTAEGLVFTRAFARAIRQEEILGLRCMQGLDFGYTNDPSAFCQVYVDLNNMRLYVYDGFYEHGMSNANIAKRITDMKAHKHKTIADSSEPKSIDYIKSKSVRIEGAAKGKDSVSAGIDFLCEFEIIVNAHLVEFMTEFGNYSWALDKEGKPTNKPVDDFNHFIDSLRYAVEPLTRNQSTIAPVTFSLTTGTNA